MQTMVRESWTDERLDEFAKRIDESFDRLADGLKSVQRAIVFGSALLSVTFVTGCVTLAIKI